MLAPTLLLCGECAETGFQLGVGILLGHIVREARHDSAVVVVEVDPSLRMAHVSLDPPQGISRALEAAPGLTALPAKSGSRIARPILTATIVVS